MNFGTLGTGFGGLGRGGAGVAFTPAGLYVGGYSGDYWDPADLTKLFQLSNGTTAVTAADNPVGYMGGQLGVHNLIQATSGNRPLYKTPGVAANLAFDDSNDQLAVATSTALFKYLHDGTGGSFWTIASAATGEDKNVIGSKGNTSATAVGSMIQRRSTTSRVRLIISNGANHVALLEPGSGTPWPADTAVMALATYSTADGARLYINGVSVASAAELASPSTSDADANFATPSLVSAAHNAGYACGAINRVLTPTEVLNLYNYYHNRGTL